MVALADRICNCGAVFTPKSSVQKACKPSHSNYEWSRYLEKLNNNFEFEIGNIYQKGNRWFIAISQTKLLTLRNPNHTIMVFAPELRGNYLHINASFEDLCRNWAITEEKLDYILDNHIVHPGLVAYRELN